MILEFQEITIIVFLIIKYSNDVRDTEKIHSSLFPSLIPNYLTLFLIIHTGLP